MGVISKPFSSIIFISIYFGGAAISELRSVVESQNAAIPRVSEPICIKEHHELNKQQRK